MSTQQSFATAAHGWKPAEEDEDEDEDSEWQNSVHIRFIWLPSWFSDFQLERIIETFKMFEVSKLFIARNKLYQSMVDSHGRQ